MLGVLNLNILTLFNGIGGLPLACDYMSYEKGIKYVEGQLKAISWLLDQE